jgi:putative NADPH-quinone reductase
MKHLVVVAHPITESFTMELTRAFTSELEKLGHGQHAVMAHAHASGTKPFYPQTREAR